MPYSQGPVRGPTPRHRPQGQGTAWRRPAASGAATASWSLAANAAILARRQRGESIRTIVTGVKASTGAVHETLADARDL
ncbi:hypothetical protein GCM10010156_69790 [Planobispora rosea]|uniref:Uncharacterized protein n=1 Tax=Planobispora rosea TaxID=35762 RepID=A0A8J3SB06_PLARO|nr:hypothetical protein GCM10010156_69790 [Planobispora rosea]GIH88404.1 hypothetical protein Pro02_68120 [Planobispora rosea]